MKHSEVVFRLFGPADEQVAEAVEPGVGALYDPAPGFLAGFFGLDFFASGPDVGGIPKLGHYLAHLSIIVARVQAQVLLVARRPVGIAGSFGRRGQATQSAFRQFHVVPVRPRQHQPYRDAPCFGQEAAFDAAFAAVRGVGTRFFPRPTALCAASRRGPSRRSSSRLSRHNPARPRPRAAQKRPPAPPAESGCAPSTLCANPSHPRLSMGSPCVAQRKWHSAPAGRQCATGGDPMGEAWAHARATMAPAVPITCRK